MRQRTFAFLLVAALGAPALARAVTYPATSVLSGEVAQSVVSGQCYIGRSTSLFQRNGAVAKAYVVISEMVASGHPANGQIELIFSSTTGGTVRLAYLDSASAGLQNAPFSGYSQTYNAATKVFRTQFKIAFPSCTLLVDGVYASP
jgi:hypothetical protein